MAIGISRAWLVVLEVPTIAFGVLVKQNKPQKISLHQCEELVLVLLSWQTSRYLNWVGKSIGINELDEWMRVPKQDVLEHDQKSCALIKTFYGGSLSKALSF